jgi:hypothetical protein
MPLPAAWVESLLAKLQVRYGEAFARQYADLDPAAVKADWAEVLEGFTYDAIAYGLRYLPSDKPPIASQFRDICRRAPAPERPRLEAPTGQLRPDLREQLAGVRARLTSRPPGYPLPRASAEQEAIEDLEDRKYAMANRVAEYARENGIPLAGEDASEDLR